MKNLFLSFIFLSLSSSFLFSQNKSFFRTYGGERYDDVRDIQRTADGCFVFTGLCKSGEDIEGDMYLTKINAAGAVLWEKFYGYAEEDGGNALIATRDGGFLISGHTAKSYGIACDGYVVKTDSEGNQEWKQFVGRAFDDVCDGVVQAKDGSFYFTGRMEDGDSRMFDVLLCKISEDGEIIFTKNIIGNQNEFGYKIAEAADGNLLIVGYQQGMHTEADDAYILKCDKLGNVIWEKTFGGNVNDRIRTILPLPSGGAVVAGGTDVFGVSPFEKMFVAKISESGEVENFKYLLESEGKGYLYDMEKNINGGYSFTGILQKENTSVTKPTLVLTDSEFNILDYKSVDVTTSTKAYAGVIGRDGKHFFAGATAVDSETPNSFIAKLDFSTTAIHDFPNLSYELFPNPFLDFTYLKMDNTPFTKNISLYNWNGQLVKTLPFEGDEIFIYKENLEKGAYVFLVHDEKGKLLASGKLMMK